MHSCKSAAICMIQIQVLLELQESRFEIELTNIQNVNMCHDRMYKEIDEHCLCKWVFLVCSSCQAHLKVPSGEDLRHHPLTSPEQAEMFFLQRYFLPPALSALMPLYVLYLCLSQWSRTTAQFTPLNRGAKSKYSFCLLKENVRAN